ncbi:UPF0711 protein C18orf21 homolog [Cololabis saira]|uniref:UPF0711 protein C18orf21 homolog n=1 Tax=Cololabis saira TaxID=129043 RepID=UPI002AD4713D|nr:UPF0711 protein C18orf21 homolog [Cololabis saira]
MKNIPEGKSNEFLFNASLLFKEKCPELSRHLLQRCVKDNETPKICISNPVQNMPACPYCYQFLKPGNHRVRLRPKRRPSARVQSVLLRQARGKRLSLVQKHLLLRFQKSSSVLMATCYTCTKTSRHKGMERDFISTFSKSHCTPGSVGKPKTPQSSNKSNMKTPSKNKTPSNTPRSSICSSISASGSTSSSSSSKKKNWVVQRLSKILLREDNQDSKKGGLKDFLSSI